VARQTDTKVVHVGLRRRRDTDKLCLELSVLLGSQDGHQMPVLGDLGQILSSAMSTVAKKAYHQVPVQPPDSPSHVLCVGTTVAAVDMATARALH